MKKIMVFIASLAMVIGLQLGVAAPASAHISTCSPTAFAPKQSSNNVLFSMGRWMCGPAPVHHDFVNVRVEIQRKVPLRWQPDAWYVVGGRSIRSTQTIGSSLGWAYCTPGTHAYRTKVILDMYGKDGSRRKTSTSYETTKKC